MLSTLGRLVRLADEGFDGPASGGSDSGLGSGSGSDALRLRRLDSGSAGGLADEAEDSEELAARAAARVCLLDIRFGFRDSLPQS